MIVIYSGQFCRITRVNIMKMNPGSAFTELGVSWRPFAGFLQVLLVILLSIWPRNIEVNYDMVFRNSDVVESSGIEIVKLGPYSVPSVCWGSIVFGVLGWALIAFAIKDRFLDIEDKFLSIDFRALVISRISLSTF